MEQEKVKKPWFVCSCYTLIIIYFPKLNLNKAQNSRQWLPLRREQESKRIRKDAETVKNAVNIPFLKLGAGTQVVILLLFFIYYTCYKYYLIGIWHLILKIKKNEKSNLSLIWDFCNWELQSLKRMWFGQNNHIIYMRYLRGPVICLFFTFAFYLAARTWPDSMNKAEIELDSDAITFCPAVFSPSIAVWLLMKYSCKTHTDPG